MDLAQAAHSIKALRQLQLQPRSPSIKRASRIALPHLATNFVQFSATCIETHCPGAPTLPGRDLSDLPEAKSLVLSITSQAPLPSRHPSGAPATITQATRVRPSDAAVDDIAPDPPLNAQPISSSRLGRRCMLIILHLCFYKGHADCTDGDEAVITAHDYNGERIYRVNAQQQVWRVGA